MLKFPPVSPSYIMEIMHSPLARSGFFFPLQATRDTFLNWGLHLCAPTFARLFSCGLSSVHISTGNITAGFPLLPPEKGEGKLIADGSLSLPSQVKAF